MRALSFLILLSACGSSMSTTDAGTDSGFLDSSSDANVELPTNVCAMEHRGANADGDPVTVCDATFDTAPFVRLPADDATTIYAGVNVRLEMVDRSGKHLLLAGANGDPLRKDLVQMGDVVPQVGPTGLRMLSNRYLFTLYRFRGAITQVMENGMLVPGFRVDAAQAVVLLDGKAIDNQFVAAWEGTVSKRISSTEWDEMDRVPVRVRFTTMKAGDPISEWGYSMKTLADGTRWTVGGTVENMNAKVRAADGSCLDALSPLGSGNPFDKAELGIQRVPGMHAPGDDVIVIGNDMSGNYSFVSPWGLIGTAPPADFTDMSFFVHGTPNGYRLDLHRVAGGGGGC